MNYLKILHKNQKIEQLLEHSQIMYEKMQNSIALEWICKIYNEYYVEESILPLNFEDKIETYYEILLNKDSQSHMAQFTKAIVLYKSGNILQTKNILTEGTNFARTI